MGRASLTMFAHVCSGPDEDIHLAEAALLVAEIAYAEVDVAGALARLDDLGRRAARALEGIVEATPRVEGLLKFLYGKEGFHGNSAEYYDPRNSFLNDVLERRTGIPISLAVVLSEVAFRAEIDARGVGFPGHFLVRSPVQGGALVIDPFEGRLLGVAELRGLYERATGTQGEVPPKVLEPASKRHVLLRMLNNLRSIYSSSGDDDKLREALERMQIVAPSEETRLELERLGGGATVAVMPTRSLN